MNSQKHTGTVTSCESVQVYLDDIRAIAVKPQMGIELEPYIHTDKEGGDWKYSLLPNGWSSKSIVDAPAQFCGMIIKKHAVAVPVLDRDRENHIVWIRWDTVNKTWEQL